VRVRSLCCLALYGALAADTTPLDLANAYATLAETLAAAVAGLPVRDFPAPSTTIAFGPGE
jgi:hypothetical protein